MRAAQWADRWGPARTVAARAVDVADRAILLPRLDPTRTLEDHPDIDVAVGVIASILSKIAEVRPVAGIPPLSEHLADMVPQLVPSPAVDPVAVVRARGRVSELQAELDDVQHHRLLHGDCHFLNVLHSAPDDSPAWVGSILPHSQASSSGK